LFDPIRVEADEGETFMSEVSKDRAEGKIDEVVGRVKAGAGEATDDQQLKDEGQGQKVGGQIKQGVADAKDKVDDVVKKVTGGS
jgi:uncharacterized protein YjbJ (UPF0337 family)